MRSLHSAILGLLMLGTSITTATAWDRGSVFTHNGSQMRMYWGDGDSMSLRYERPRSGLGVSPGTVLFEGTVAANGHTYGYAKVFKSGCRPAEYEVEGEFIEDYLYLEGYAPIRSGCRVIGYEVNQHSRLNFEYLRD